MKNMVKTILVLAGLVILIIGCFVFIIINDPSLDDNADDSGDTLAVESVSSGVRDEDSATILKGEQSSNKQDENSSISPKVQVFLDAIKNVYEMVHNGDFQYGNSQSVPPCDDGLISGDRLVSRALWDMGYTDQPIGGVTDLGPYLTKHGFEVIMDKTQLRAGDIVQIDVYDNPNGKPGVYTFVLASYDPETERCEKYDMTPTTMQGESRLKCNQPFDTLLEENGNMRIFRQAFRIN